MAERRRGSNGSPSTPLDPSAPYVVPQTLPDTGPARFSEYGVSGLKIWSGIVSEEFLPELRGAKGRQVYQEMRDNDTVVGALMMIIEMAFRRTEPVIVPARPVDQDDRPLDPTPADVEAARFLRGCLDDMSHTWADAVTNITECFPYGWELMEIVYKERRGKNPTGTLPDGTTPSPSKYDDGRIGWRKWAHRSQHTLERWEMDPKGGLQGMWQRSQTGLAQRVFIPISKALLFKTRDAAGNPEGRSILRNAYVAFYYRKNLQALEGIALERMGSGIPVIKLPEGATATDQTNAENAVRRFRVDEQMGFVVPAGTELDIAFGGGRTLGASFEAAIVRYRQEMLLSVLTQFIGLGLDRVGSYALSRTGRDVFQMALDGWLRSIEGVVNRFAIPRLIDLNDFGQLSGYPKLDLGVIGDINLELLITALEKLVPLGALAVTDELRNRLSQAFGIPEPEANTEGQSPEAEPKESEQDFGEDACPDCGEELDDDGACPECDIPESPRGERLTDLPEPVQERIRQRGSRARGALDGPQQRNGPKKLVRSYVERGPDGKIATVTQEIY